MRVCYVHGAGASLRSFKWLVNQLPAHEQMFFEYTTRETVSSVATRLAIELCDPIPTMLIGHSLGGIISTMCAVALPNVTKLVTLCAPYGGVKHAEIMSMFSFEPLFHDLRNYGPLLMDVRATPVLKPHLAIVGTKGLPFTSEANDGVVTVASQMAYNTPYIMLPLNHFEVLLSADVSDLIAEFMKD